jgi:hypothetical protein
MQYHGATDEMPDENHDVKEIAPAEGQPPSYSLDTEGSIQRDKMAVDGGNLLIRWHLRPSGAVRVLPFPFHGAHSDITLLLVLT